MMGARIISWGAALPDKTMTNTDLEARIDTTDEWIRERTGIRERRIGGSTTELAVEAGGKALTRAGLTGADIGLVMLCTTTPDRIMPANAAMVQDQLGVAGGAFDLNAACSGFVYGLVAAHGMVAAGSVERILLIGAETMSRIIDWDDRNTAVLFGDGGGAVVIEACERDMMLASDLGSDGATRHLLYVDHGGYLQMEGKEVFRRAVRACVDSTQRTLQKAGLTADDIDVVIPHQANTRIVDAACGRLGIPLDKTVSILERTGNTSAASIPLALAEAADEGRLHDGDLVLMVGFGAGMSWASALVRWQLGPEGTDA
jgi:3-oxoacyl-[acyl-carrier-protein] synthase-3